MAGQLRADSGALCLWANCVWSRRDRTASEQRIPLRSTATPAQNQLPQLVTALPVVSDQRKGDSGRAVALAD